MTYGRVIRLNHPQRNDVDVRTRRGQTQECESRGVTALQLFVFVQLSLHASTLSSELQTSVKSPNEICLLQLEVQYRRSKLQDEDLARDSKSPATPPLLKAAHTESRMLLGDDGLFKLQLAKRARHLSCRSSWQLRRRCVEFAIRRS
ncbi:hypothetical protein NQZ68_004964 [Dissostichus eleginoides]|nr:hypothetical protein NQZ68_004964 [Dissostichus eleginoides]